MRSMYPVGPSNRPRRTTGRTRRTTMVAGVVAAIVAVVLVGTRVLAADWWAVPGLIAGTTSQGVPRNPQIEPPIAIQSSPQVGTSGTDRAAGTAPGTSGASAAPAATAAPVQEPSVLLPRQRFTVLLLGSDNDKKFTPEAVLTQSMILVSIDPVSHQVAMVSIPRDFWVDIPTYGYQKIDVAYEVGGIALARATVEKLFNVRVDYYAWVGLDGLVKVIDSLGGVDVDVQHPVLDETYPDDLVGPDPFAYFRLYLPAGPQHLDGTTALEYVRSRHGDLQSDFGRSARQQQVLVAIKNRVQTLSVVGRVPQLVAALQGSVKTDLSLADILQLAALAHKVPA